MKKIVIFPVIILVRAYQIFISPFLGKNCRFHPTCSQYMIEALKIHGLFVGLYLGVNRIFRCHPWGKTGYDPVPKKLFKR